MSAIFALSTAAALAVVVYAGRHLSPFGALLLFLLAALSVGSGMIVFGGA